MTLFVKKIILSVLFFEVMLFLMLYYFGPNGLHILNNLQVQKKSIVYDIAQLIKDIDCIEEKIQDNRSDFAKERIARERLLMKKENEIIYFIK